VRPSAPPPRAPAPARPIDAARRSLSPSSQLLRPSLALPQAHSLTTIASTTPKVPAPPATGGDAATPPKRGLAASYTAASPPPGGSTPGEAIPAFGGGAPGGGGDARGAPGFDLRSLPTPSELVAALDVHVVGQEAAKRVRESRGKGGGGWAGVARSSRPDPCHLLL
jgi:hypothetical protein